MPEAYHGAAYEVTDAVFLMDEIQIYNMWKNLGEVKAVLGEDCDPLFTKSVNIMIIFCVLHQKMNWVALLWMKMENMGSIHVIFMAE